MKWFRSNIKHGSRIALLALAIQFVLSFGHHHGAAALAAPAVSAQASDTGGTRAKTLATKKQAAQDAAVKDSAKASATDPAKPASGHHQDNDYCAVCAVMALAGTVLFTEPPVLLLPEAYHFLYRATDAEFNHLESQRVVFQPRAPPAS
jgi:hypothetical protein